MEEFLEVGASGREASQFAAALGGRECGGGGRRLCRVMAASRFLFPPNFAHGLSRQLVRVSTLGRSNDRRTGGGNVGDPLACRSAQSARDSDRMDGPRDARADQTSGETVLGVRRG